MSIGEKLFELRKRYGYSQEQVAEKIGVARQTISKWELNETSPDLESAKKLAQLYHISLDEMVGNPVYSIQEEKHSNVEKLAGILIHFLKWAGIALCVFFILMITLLVPLYVMRIDIRTVSHKGAELYSFKMACRIDDQQYLINIHENSLECEDCSDAMRIELLNSFDWSDLDSVMESIEVYFEQSHGTCSLMETEHRSPVK